MTDDVRLQLLQTVERQNDQLLWALEAISKATASKSRIKAFARTVVRTHRTLKAHAARTRKPPETPVVDVSPVCATVVE
jgi:hypothetical protein